jgi:hypothetical protein
MGLYTFTHTHTPLPSSLALTHRMIDAPTRLGGPRSVAPARPEPRDTPSASLAAVTASAGTVPLPGPVARFTVSVTMPILFFLRRFKDLLPAPGDSLSLQLQHRKSYTISAFDVPDATQPSLSDVQTLKEVRASVSQAECPCDCESVTIRNGIWHACRLWVSQPESVLTNLASICCIDRRSPHSAPAWLKLRHLSSLEYRYVASPYPGTSTSSSQ